jgi:Flp pilus assembly protein TadG
MRLAQRSGPGLGTPGCGQGAMAMGIGSYTSWVSTHRIGRQGLGLWYRFRADERGTLVIFALMLSILMLMVGGIAVDVMRYESRRTSLQNTLDRSTLAAASLTQDMNPEAVVNDYFLKAGLAEYLTSVTVTESMTSREVSATASADTGPLFLKMMGIDEFDANGLSTAEQTINNVEISLVLDVSGSMSGTKIANLRAAAASFVQTVLAGDDDHHVSVSIVPYNAQVNLDPALREKFQATHVHDVADVNCLELPDSVFSTTRMPRNLNLPMFAFADIAYSTSKVDAFVSPRDATYGVPQYDNTFCKQNTNNMVRLPNNDLAELQGQINGLTADGNTSIVLGLKHARPPLRL